MGKKLLLSLCLLLLGWGFSLAEARRIEILEADRLELRNVTPPNGEAEEFVIISGVRVRLKIDDDELEATRVEINKTRRLLTVIGQGVYRSKSETLSGRDFTVNLEDEHVSGEDVIIATSQIDVVGIDVERLPGQIEVNDGYFSPCGRCNQNPNDYAFRASNLTIYPGDRLIAYNVTVLLADDPMFYLPVVVILLNDPNRQPRFAFKNNKEDGDIFELDVPFVTPAFGLGFNMFRYFGNRNPRLGFGVDYRAYLFESQKPTQLFFFALPPADSRNGLTSTTGMLYAYQFDTSGRIWLSDGFGIDSPLPPLSFTFAARRVDVDRLNAGFQPTDLRGVTGPDKRTDLSGQIGFENQQFSLRLAVEGFFDHKDYGAAPEGRQRETNLPLTPRYLPELRGSLLGTGLPTWGPLNLSRFEFSIGNITAPVNPLNRSARLLNPDSNFINAGRVSIGYALNLNLPLWPGAKLTASQDFTGRYYTTRNPIPTSTTPTSADGELERNVQMAVQVGFEQTFSTAFILRLGYSFRLLEGESPFAFDAVPRRSPEEKATLELRAQPFSWLGATAKTSFDFRRKEYKLDPTTFELTINPAPLQATGTLVYDAGRNEMVSWDAKIANTVGSGLSFSVSTGYIYATTTAKNINPLAQDAFKDLQATLGYRSPSGQFSATVTLLDNINFGEIKNWTFSSSLTIGPRETPITASVSQTFTPAPQCQNQCSSIPPTRLKPLLSGSVSLSAFGISLSLSNNIDFSDWPNPKTGLPAPPSSLQLSLSGGDTLAGTGGLSWRLTYSGQVDLDPDVEFFNPNLSATFAFTRTNAELSTTLSFLAPSKVQSEFELQTATVRTALDIFPWLSLQGNITFNRQKNATSGVITDTYSFNPNFGATIALARAGQPKPEVFLSVFLKGNYSFTYAPPDSPLTTIPTPLGPVFVLTFDRCCYALQLTFDASNPKGASFKFEFLLPTGGKQSVIESDPDKGIRFPLLPFIPPILPRSSHTEESPTMHTTPAVWPGFEPAEEV